MPYGVPKELGGDSQANTDKMDRCVSHVMSREASMQKANAIAICKHSLGFTLARAERKAGAVRSGRVSA